MSKLPTTILTALFALGLAACGGNNATPDSGGTDAHAGVDVQGGGDDVQGGGDDVQGGDDAPAVDCTTLTDCAMCANTEGCGWCAGTHHCLAANDDGSASADMTCTGAMWDYYGASCTGPGSLMEHCMMGNMACGDCTPLEGCGWCNTTNTCMVTNADGTGSYDGTCTGAAWAYLPSDCAGAGDGGTTTDAGATGDGG